MNYNLFFGIFSWQSEHRISRIPECNGKSRERIYHFSAERLGDYRTVGLVIIEILWYDWCVDGNSCDGDDYAASSFAYA